MKIKLLAAVCSVVILCALTNTAGAQGEKNVQSFWKTFKTAVSKKDKNAVAGLTMFPLSMPYGAKAVRTKADFLKRYDEIFNGETDAAKCFAKAEPIKTDAKHYVVSCGFKNHLDDKDNQPIQYGFELTGKTGWKFAGLDNINE